MILILMLVATVQPIVAPIRPCPVVVDVVDPAWAPLPGITVTLRDERTRTQQVAVTDENGMTRFTVQSCADDRCRVSVSASHAEFKAVTLKRLWFGDHQDLGRRVQIRLREFTRGDITVR
jgi:hypothetical protein